MGDPASPKKKRCKRLLLLCLSLSLISILVISAILSTVIPPKIITHQSSYWDLYSPFSDIYIKEMVPSEEGAIVYFYPEGSVTFSFITDGAIRKDLKGHFIECTRIEGGKYITITDTDIPFLPKTNLFIRNAPVGNASDFSTMKYLFNTPREGACDAQVDFMIRLAREHDITARRINLWQYPTNGILTAGGHTTMEVYDRETRQWIWMDPLYNITEGKIGSLPLTLYELQIAVNRGENITLTMVDGSDIQFDEWQYARVWKNYLNPSQLITYEG